MSQNNTLILENTPRNGSTVQSLAYFSTTVLANSNVQAI